MFAFCSAILLRAAVPPRVAPARQTGGQPIVDPTGKSAVLRTPARRLVDMQNTLPAYLATGGDLGYLAAISPVPALQAEQAGLTRIFPALEDVHRESFFGRIPDVEQLLRLDPDAIIASQYAGAMLRGLGFPAVFALGPVADIPARLAACRLVGAIDGQPARTRRLLAWQAAQLSNLRGETHALADARAVILFGGRGYWTIAGRGYYLNDVLSLAHVTNLAAAGTAWSQVDLERLLLLDPDVIFLNAQPGDAYTPETLYRDPRWQALRAVRAKHVYKLPGIAVFLGPAEQVLLARWFAEVTHPELPARLRAAYRAAYLSTYARPANDALIDRELNLTMNASSAGYGRFARRE